MQAADLARNRWHDLLAHFGIDQKSLTGKHSPCPACGGRDRFRFDDQDGRGTYFCSHCGSGDGFALLGKVKGWAFKQAAAEVERIVGAIPATSPSRPQQASDKLAICRRIWSESQPVAEGDPVALYLANRTGIVGIPGCIRFHGALPYRHEDGRITRHPAMVAKVQDADGNGVAIHRTYLTSDGQKASVPSAKKIVGGLSHCSAVRLMPPAECIGIAEGIETALSASIRFAVPTWAAISANGLEKWIPPAGTARVMVFGDNDLSYTGQAAAFALAKRLTATGITTEIHIPDRPGTDWADYMIDFSTTKEQQK